MKNILKMAMLLFVAFVSQSATAQNLDEIVAKHIEAIGGKDAWMKLKTMHSEASIKSQGVEVKLTINQIDKVAMRVNIAVMGMEGYQIITQKEGWKYMPFAGQAKAEAVSPEEIKMSQDQLNIQEEFITYKELGKKIEFLGKDEIEGTECYKILLTDKEGVATTHYIDASNYLTIKEVSKYKLDGKEIESTTQYSNYKKLDSGILFPMNTSGDQGDMEFTKIEINPKIDEAIFKPSTK